MGYREDKRKSILREYAKQILKAYLESQKAAKAAQQRRAQLAAQEPELSPTRKLLWRAYYQPTIPPKQKHFSFVWKRIKPV